ncbi:MAG TPA: oxygen-dependent coproporphyrinogen oxidase [Rhodothermales bacterium]|nr:oxygen-dependent coproporphyrinogen oxidase [Rhodothermales bacterium]
MLDNEERLARLRETPRTDISLAHRMQRFVEALQQSICKGLEDFEPEVRFRTDTWKREGGGGGTSRVLEGGQVFEKAGVNTSAVHGDLPERTAVGLNVEPMPFFATGISLVIHPCNPFVPAVHANFRYFALGEDLFNPRDQWFGGGADLTPTYPFLEDAQHFHAVWKEVCDHHPEIADYADFKRRCDTYFYLPHRGETRGVGGIFYDYLRGDPEATFFFAREAGRAFLRSYVQIVERRRATPYGARERTFQEIRRGRYAEFNLLFDRGTRFGIETEGRTESILMSLPPRVQWHYDWRPQPDSPEGNALWYFHPHDWLALTKVDVP